MEKNVIEVTIKKAFHMNLFWRW